VESVFSMRTAKRQKKTALVAGSSASVLDDELVLFKEKCGYGGFIAWPVPFKQHRVLLKWTKNRLKKKLERF
jgi:hypothetical protein